MIVKEGHTVNGWMDPIITPFMLTSVKKARGRMYYCVTHTHTHTHSFFFCSAVTLCVYICFLRMTMDHSQSVSLMATCELSFIHSFHFVSFHLISGKKMPSFVCFDHNERFSFVTPPNQWLSVGGGVPLQSKVCFGLWWMPLLPAAPLSGGDTKL